MSGYGKITEVFLEPAARHQIRVTLAEALGTGAHGRVRLLGDQRYDQLVVKISNNPVGQRIAERVEALMRVDPKSWAANRMFRVAWPLARVLSVTDGTVIGFAMPRLAAPAYHPMPVMFHPPERRKAFPGTSWNRYLMLAAELSRTVAEVNDRGYTIGDLCPENLFVTHGATVVITDVDDWQIGRTGEPGALPCRGGRQGYTAPEHMSGPDGDTFRNPTSDWWALAVTIGEILFVGRRPFEGFPPGVGDVSWDEQDNVAGRHCWLLDDSIRVGPGTPSRDLLPGRLRRLFEACFDAGYANPAGRPSPLAWAAALDATLSELTVCPAFPLHVYPREARRCPWCHAVSTASGGRAPPAHSPPTPRTLQHQDAPQPQPQRSAPASVSTGGCLMTIALIAPMILMLAVH